MSDWSKVTRPIPVPNEWTKPFWDAAKQGVLALQRCQSCRHFQHPPYATCVNCMGIDLKFEPVSGKGRLYTWSVMHMQSITGFEDRVPYTTLLVELDEQPKLLLLSYMEGRDEGLQVGQRCEVYFDQVEDFTLPQFRVLK